MTQQEILEVLKKGPKLQFGSDRQTDRALQSLRKAGVIRYVKVNAGGRGWELLSPAPTEPEP